MRTAHRLPHPRRPGLTLVELLVVFIIIAGLAGMAILVFPKLQDSQRATKGADIVQGQLFVAKQMALRDQLPRGVRLARSSNNPGPDFDQIQLIEQPPAYSTGVVPNPIIAPNVPWPVDPNNGWFVVTFIADPITGAVPDFSNGTVQPGDLLDLAAANDNYTVATPPATGAMHLIMKKQDATANSPAMVWVLTQPQISYTGSPFPFYYRIIRTPRPLTGEAPVSLPKNIVVAAPNNGTGSIIPQDTSGNFDVLFDPSGKVLRAAGTQGKVVLWVMDTTPQPPLANGSPGPPGDQMLIAVYTRNGLIMAAPVNLNAGIGNPPGNPYHFVTDGATSGM